MKIALCAVEKESNPEATFLNVSSYCSLLNKKAGISFAFFPFDRFETLDENSSIFAALVRLSTKYGFAIGIGSKESGKDVYWIFKNGLVQKAVSSIDISIVNRAFKLVINEIPNDFSFPAIWLSSELHALDKLARISKEREIYYLGYSNDSYYQAAVFQNGKIKCRIPEDHPNILVKSVPDAA